MTGFAIWILCGLIMMLLELLVPGGIIVFLGMSAVMVGSAVYFGLLTHWMDAVIAWFILSLLLILGVRSFFIQFFEGDSKVDNVDEDLDIIGAVVEVVQDVLPYKDGRVRFRDSTWPARSDEELSAGSKARVIQRQGNSLIIESI